MLDNVLHDIVLFYWILLPARWERMGPMGLKKEQFREGQDHVID